MDLGFTAADLALRDEIREFCRTAQPEHIRRKLVLGQHLSPGDYIDWQRILDNKGWAVPHWPKEWGGTGWSASQLFIYNEELQKAPALLPENHNTAQVGPVIIAFGTEEQKQRFLPKIRNLDYWFCQGFSEPGSGSDLASLKTSAVRSGDEYIVQGQKMWTSQGHNANWMFALVRTDPGAKKQKGITYLLIDMKSPGITVRPIMTIGGHRVNEIFFDNVRVPLANRIGEENKGWDYAKFLMGNSRINVARIGLSTGRLQRAKQWAARIMVEGVPLADMERFREKVAAIEVELKAIEITNMRIVADQMKNASKKHDPKSSILKLKGAELQQASAELLMEVAGPLSGPSQEEFLEHHDEDSIGPDWCAGIAPTYFVSRAISIVGGSNEVQHNIIAKNILQL